MEKYILFVYSLVKPFGVTIQELLRHSFEAKPGKSGKGLYVKTITWDGHIKDMPEFRWMRFLGELAAMEQRKDVMD